MKTPKQTEEKLIIELKYCNGVDWGIMKKINIVVSSHPSTTPISYKLVDAKQLNKQDILTLIP